MSLLHPLTWLPPKARAWAFAASFTLGAGVMTGWGALNTPLQTEVAPDGVVTLEYAGTLDKARDVIESWGDEGRVFAGANLGLDYLFLLVYSGTILLGCVVARVGFAKWTFAVSVGAVLAWLQIVAALADATENYALLQLVLGSADPDLPVVALWAARVKASLNAIGVGYTGVGLGLLVLLKFVFKTRVELHG